MSPVRVRSPALGKAYGIEENDHSRGWPFCGAGEMGAEWVPRVIHGTETGTIKTLSAIQNQTGSPADVVSR
jgi:hypothetical protein